MHYVYKITNKINQKCYIGITHNIEERWGNHTSDYSIRTIKRPLYKAFQKYGKENFTITKLYECLTEEEAKHLQVNVICEHCSKSVSKGNYYRWHGSK